MQRAAGVRFTDYQQHRVDINLRIYSRGKRWDMDIKALGRNSQRLPIALTPKALGERCDALQAEMHKVVCHTALGGKDAARSLKADRAELAKAGNALFRDIFGGARMMMRQLLNLGREVYIEINSEDFSVPWELLYSDSLNAPLYENFWGMKYIISRVINQEERPGDIAPTTIHVASKPRLGLLTYKNLPGVAQREIPFFEKLKEDGKITLVKLPPLDPADAKRKQELDKFKHFWDKSFHVAHFACHARYDDKKSFRSFIQLTNGIRITLDDLARADITIRDYPLVILNACEMGQMSSMDVRYFAGDFIKYGALGVVATEAAVPDKFATEVTRHLYAHLLDGKYLGQSMLLTRQELLQLNNPVGLLYSLYAPPIIKLEVKSGSRGRKTGARRPAAYDF
jgi:hypothetical protein